MDDGTRVGWLELLATAAAYGLVAGSAFSAWDLQHHVRGALGSDLLLVSLFGALPGLAVGLASGLVLGVLLRALPVAPRRAQWAGVLAAVMVVALGAAGAILVLAWTDWRGVALVAGASLVGAVLFVLFDRLAGRMDVPGRALALGLAALLAVFVARGGGPVLGALGVTSLAGVAPPALALVVLLFGLFVLRSHPGLVALACLLGLIAMLVALPWSSASTLDPIGARRVQKASDAPNVVVIVLDTTRRDYLGCYGHQGGLTPVLDRLASEGAVYDDAFSPSHWTAPSHASLFTGLPPVSHGLSREFHMLLGNEAHTMAEILGERGYETVALYSNPWIARANMLQGFDRSASVLGKYYELSMIRFCLELGWPERWTDKGGDQARRALTRWLATRRQPEKPFFLFVNLLEAHAPYCPPRAERKAYLPEGVSYREATRISRYLPVRELHLARQHDERRASVTRGMYQAGIRYQDRRLGDLFDTLGRWVDLDDTLVVVTADHGENIDDDGRWEHEFAINDTLIHVPLVIRYPRLFPAGTRQAGLCSLTDVLPTALAVVDPEGPPVATEGRSLVPGSFEPRDAVFAQMFPHFADFELVMRKRGDLGVFNAHWRAVRTDRWKYVWSSDGEHRLYDLEADPGETENVLEAHPDVAAELGRRIGAWWEAQPAYQMPEQALEPIEADDMTLLHGLGYGGRH